jgi:L-ascorbate metabolism protein UlaG (beta-lactamase superfamily)
MSETRERPWHHLPDGTFRNPPGSPGRQGSGAAWRGFIWRRVVSREARVPLPPGHLLDEAATAAGIAALGAADGITWLGHACFLIRIGGRTLLTDPYLTAYASPLPPFGPKRFTPAPIAPERLPPVDIVLLSHNHYDHLDLRTLKRLAGGRPPVLVAPLGLPAYLDRRLHAEAHVLDWHQAIELLGLRIEALPAIHFTKRRFFDRNRSLWCGYRIDAPGRSLHFTGDTAFGPVFAETARRHPAVDMALVPIGAYAPRELMRGSHCTPEEGVEIGRILGARRLCAMHWGTIRLTDEPPFEPPERYRAAAGAAGWAPDDAWLLAVGETRRL